MRRGQLIPLSSSSNPACSSSSPALKRTTTSIAERTSNRFNHNHYIHPEGRREARREARAPGPQPQLSFLYPPSCFSSSFAPKSISTPRRSYSSSTQSGLEHVIEHNLHDSDLQNLAASSSSTSTSGSTSTSTSASTSTLTSHSSTSQSFINGSLPSQSSSTSPTSTEDEILHSISAEGEKDSTFEKTKRYLETRVFDSFGTHVSIDGLNVRGNTNGHSQGKGKGTAQAEGERGIPDQQEVLSYIQALEPSFSGGTFPSSNLNLGGSVNGKEKEGRNYNKGSSTSQPAKNLQSLTLPIIKAYYSQNLFYQAGKILIFLLLGLEQLERNSVREMVEKGKINGKDDREGREHGDAGDGDGDYDRGMEKGKKKKPSESHAMNFSSVDLIRKETQVLIPEILRDLIKESELRVQASNRSSDSAESSHIKPVPASTSTFDPLLPASILSSSFSLNWDWSTCQSSLETSKILVKVVRDCFRNLEMESGVRLLRVLIRGVWEAEMKLEKMGGDREEQVRHGNADKGDHWMEKMGQSNQSSTTDSSSSGKMNKGIPGFHLDLEVSHLRSTLDFLKKSIKNLIENYSFNLRFNLRTYERILRESHPETSGNINLPSKNAGQVSGDQLVKPFPKRGNKGKERNGTETDPIINSLLERKDGDQIRLQYATSVGLLGELVAENMFPLAPNHAEGSSNLNVQLLDLGSGSNSNPDSDLSSEVSSSTEEPPDLGKSSTDKRQKGEDINWLLKRCFQLDDLISSNLKSNLIPKPFSESSSSSTQQEQSIESELRRISKGIKKNLTHYVDGRLPIGFSNSDLEKGHERVLEIRGLTLSDPSNSSNNASRSSLPNDADAQIFRQIRSRHLSQFSYNSLSNHFLNQFERRRSQPRSGKSGESLGLAVLKQMVDLNRFKEEDWKLSREVQRRENRSNDEPFQGSLEIDQVTLNIVNRSNRLSRRRNKSSVNLVSSLEKAKEEREEIAKEISVNATTKERKNIKSLTEKSNFLELLDREIEKEDIYSINEFLMDFLVTTGAGREKWWPSPTVSEVDGKRFDINKGDVISVRHLIYHLYPQLNKRRIKNESKLTREERQRLEKRKQFLKNPILLTSCLNLAVKNGRTGLAISVWALIRKESLKSFNPETRSLDKKGKPWHVPLEAATLFFQLSAQEAKRGLEFKTFLPKYQTHATNFRFFHKYLEDENSDPTRITGTGSELSGQAHEEDKDNISYFNGRFRERKNLEIRSLLQKKFGRRKLKFDDERKGMIRSGRSGRFGERIQKTRIRKRWSMKLGRGMVEKRGKIYLPGRRRARFTRSDEGSNPRRRRGTGWLRASESRKIRRRDAARQNARFHYGDLMLRWGYYSPAASTTDSVESSGKASNLRNSSHETRAVELKSIQSAQSSSEFPRHKATPIVQLSSIRSSKAQPPKVDARLFNSLLEIFGKPDGMIMRETRQPKRDSVIKKLRTEISIWENNERAHQEREKEKLEAVSIQQETKTNVASTPKIPPPSSSYGHEEPLPPATQIFLTRSNAHQLLSKTKPLDPMLVIVLRDFYHLGFRIPLAFLQYLPFALDLEGDEARKILEEMLRREEEVGKGRMGRGRGMGRVDLYRLQEGKVRTKGLN